MAYYNRENKKLDIRNMRYLDSGSFGAVYLKEDTIIKIYHPGGNSRSRCHIYIAQKGNP